MSGCLPDETLVSVVIPVFNVGAYVARTVQSLLAQSHRRWQAIVIDDGSSDDTAAQIETFDDERIRLIRQANAGVSAARNRGIAVAEGAALLFLDGDDWLAPDALSRMLAALLPRPDAVAAYGAFCFVSEDGRRVVHSKRGPFPAGDIVERLLVENLFANGGHMLLRADAATRLGGFRSDLRFGEDWEYWCRLALSGAVVVVPGGAPLLFVRQRSSGAYLNMATDPQVFTPCTEAIFSNPALRERFGDRGVERLRRNADAENRWIVGTESMRHGDAARGLRSLRHSFFGRPSLKRAILVTIAHLLPLLPARLRGPFRRYGPAAHTGEPCT